MSDVGTAMQQTKKKIEPTTGARFSRRTLRTKIVNPFRACWNGIPASISPSSNTKPIPAPNMVNRNGIHVHAARPDGAERGARKEGRNPPAVTAPGFLS